MKNTTLENYVEFGRMMLRENAIRSSKLGDDPIDEHDPEWVTLELIEMLWALQHVAYASEACFACALEAAQEEFKEDLADDQKSRRKRAPK